MIWNCVNNLILINVRWWLAPKSISQALLKDELEATSPVIAFIAKRENLEGFFPWRTSQSKKHETATHPTLSQIWHIGLLEKYFLKFLLLLELELLTFLKKPLDEPSYWFCCFKKAWKFHCGLFPFYWDDPENCFELLYDLEPLFL